VVIAYEPIWTIGTGRMAPLEHTKEVGALVRGVVAERSSEQATRTRVLYGGSVSPDNAATLLALDDVDGLLVGEPSLDADMFLSILNASTPRERVKESGRSCGDRAAARVDGPSRPWRCVDRSRTFPPPARAASEAGISA
jgi:hypothetical protein